MHVRANQKNAARAQTAKVSPESAPLRPRPEDGRRALRDHAVERAKLARERYGPEIRLAELQRILADREIVRYPTQLEFDGAALERGEFAHLEPRGRLPSEGFRLAVHPRLRGDEDAIVLAASYHLVRVNYGDAANRVEAELFGAALCGLDVDRYYERLVILVDELARDGALPCD